MYLILSWREKAMLRIKQYEDAKPDLWRILSWREKAMLRIKQYEDAKPDLGEAFNGSNHTLDDVQKQVYSDTQPVKRILESFTDFDD